MTRFTRSPADLARSRASRLCGVSLAALAAAAAEPASAQTLSVLRAVMGQAGIPSAAQQAMAAQNNYGQAPTNPAMAAALARAAQNQGHFAQAVSLAQQAQAAARAAAAAMQPQVPNGLAVGGLQIAPNLTSAAQDPTGTHTWDGANLPTANSQNPDQVTIVQTRQQAVLSWTTFNVGQQTSLNFQQQPNWVVLNRVVGQIDPTTGLRNPALAPAPSRILGAINAPGTVLVINQNGILFSPTAQINVNSLIATSLEVGPPQISTSSFQTLSARNTEFLANGLLGFGENNPSYSQTFSAQATGVNNLGQVTGYDPLLEQPVEVAQGATIDTGANGFALLIAPRVINGGEISSPHGQISLVSGRSVTFTASSGDANSVDPNLRGLAISSTDGGLIGGVLYTGDYVDNQANSLLSAPGGYISLQATNSGGVLDAGVLGSTTSVALNGYVDLRGGNIELAPGAVIGITPDTGPASIPQAPASVTAFKTSVIRIGDTGANIDIGADSLVYAPSANISIGADPGQVGATTSHALGPSRVFIDTGAVIDAAGVPDVLIPASRNLIRISPVTQNDLNNTPNYRGSFLDGITVYVDPRLSGVRSDGVAWVGSPLISAATYYAQVGVTASELMTPGGTVTIGAAAVPVGGVVGQSPDVIIKAGATIDVTGGWRTFQAGQVQTTKLVDASGNIVDIGQADPNDTFVGVYTGYTSVQPRWGVVQTWGDPILLGAHEEGAYTEGRDAGGVILKASAIVLDGQVYADAFAGPQQLAVAQPGTAAGSLYGDVRRRQGAPSQLPSGGYLDVQALGTDLTGNYTGGGDIQIVGGADYGPLPGDFAYGQEIGFAADGSLIIPSRPPASLLPTNRLDVISLNADALSAMGLSQLTVQTSGAIGISADSSVGLNPGGAFEATAGRAITVNGKVSVPSGSIDLANSDFAGSVFVSEPLAPGAMDVTVNGQLSAAGRWVNDDNAVPGQFVGPAWQNGGEVTLYAAPRIDPNGGYVPINANPPPPTLSVDDSGSILVNVAGALNVTGGGYVAPNGNLSLSARGGNVSLIDDTTYFQLAKDSLDQGGNSAFRVSTILSAGLPTNEIPVNPSSINARVDLAPGAILAHGFGGGGSFFLSTPAFSFGDGQAVTGTQLPLDFFPATGFSSYTIKSYATDLIPNAFDNGFGGYNAVLATQVLTLAPGQSLNLSQSYFSPVLGAAQVAQLRGFATGGDLNTIVTPVLPTDAWDAKAVNLTLGGLMELHVEQGAHVVGAPGAALSLAQLWNEGSIRLPGGTLGQAEVLPALYVSGSGTGENTAVAVHNLSDVFTTLPDGTIAENAPNALGLKDAFGTVLTNAQVAAQDYVYLLGDLNAGEGVRLGTGGVTDVSGEAIVNPRATPMGGAPLANYVDGAVIGGGVFTTAVATGVGGQLFRNPGGNSVYNDQNVPLNEATAAEAMNAQPGAVIDLQGASAIFDRPIVQTPLAAGGPAPSYGPTAVWSNGGALSLGSGGTLAGADILAQGGAPQARAGTLTLADTSNRWTLVQADPSQPTPFTVSSSQIAMAGFDTVAFQGGFTSAGDVTLDLRGALFVTDRPNDGGLAASQASSRDAYAPIIGAGGNLTVDAAYIGLDGGFQAISTPIKGTPGTSSVTFNAGAIDVTGAVLFDQSVASVTLNSTGDLRLIGAIPYQQAFNTGQTFTPSLSGQLAVNGNLNIKAAQVYPTTGTSFTITSAAQNGLIDFERSSSATPAAPYSARGSLDVQASQINQNGIVRAPLGTLTLGGDAPLIFTQSNVPVQFAPATATLNVGAGSLTSVSTDGLVIPYGTTTDQIEWYFNPTNGSPLTAPPAAVLNLAGGSVNVASGAAVDLKGGGDIYAYEFIAGTGGSRDVLSQFNSDSFTSNGGYQYADHRQVYAIVPSLANAPAAPYDPIYSADYAPLYGPSQVGQQVYLSAGPGLAAGWYTLLPAQYAFLPGGMRLVQDTGAATPTPGASAVLKDGTVVVAGVFGDSAEGTSSSNQSVFDVQSQAAIRNEANIALTTGNAYFAAQAAHSGTATPRLPIDAGRLIINPLTALSIAGTFETTPATGGRGSEVDITGNALDIVAASQGGGGQGGAIVLTDAALKTLNAASLLLGGVRTDNADGTTSLEVTTNAISVQDGVNLSAPDILMSTDGQGASLTIANGATITASGADTDPSAGEYLITGSTAGQSAQGQFVRVSTGPQRLVVRANQANTVVPGSLTLGAAALSGASVELESSGDLLIDPNAKLTAVNLALGAAHVSFGADQGQGGLVVTAGLQAQIGQSQFLTIQSENALQFQSGAYGFGNLTLDAPGLADQGGGPVTVNAGVLQLANSATTPAACGAAGAPTCGSDTLALDATQIVFQSGTLQTYGFGGGVSLAAPQGVIYDGAAGLNVGSANLTITTPFLGDRGPGTAGATLPSLTLASTGAVAVAAPTGGGVFTPPGGTPGASLTIDGQTVAVTGATLRATAGALTLGAQDGITVAGGATLSTPGYVKVFGDPVSPTAISAPGGTLELTTASGDIAVSGDSHLVIYGGQGQAGTLVLSAHNGRINAPATTFAVGPAGSGASISLDSGAAFDLASFVQAFAPAFSGSITIRAGAGNLDLNAGQTLKAANVQLVADGGLVSIGGTIDTSGINGGDIHLYGEQGVHLLSTAMLDAHADGFGPTDTRQARGGNVTLGVDGSGAILVDSGATIDVAALHPQNRLVPMARTNGTYYSYAAGDQGGTVTFRAPVIGANGAQTVNVTFAGAVDGASSVVLEGFQRFDLAALANLTSNCLGVCIQNGQAVLNLASQAGVINPLSDASGPLVQFVHDFNVQASYGNLGGLATQANFHARPGMELDYSGDIVLNSNWNLGAGSVDLAGAVAAGLMAPVPGVAGQFYVLPGDEAAVFSGFTTLLYRVGGSVTGEPGVLTVRAGGALDLKGSITDGFFQFHDQTDPNYLSHALGGGDFGYRLQTSCSQRDCAKVRDWTPNRSSGDYVGIVFPRELDPSMVVGTAPAPYSPAANGADAAGDQGLIKGTGDPLGSAQLFPLVSNGAGGERGVDSWSYQLVAGADLVGAAGAPSVDPLAAVAGSSHGLTVQGENVYGYQGTKSLLDGMFLGLPREDGTPTPMTAAQWYAAFVAANPGVSAKSYTKISFGGAPAGVRTALEMLADQFFGSKPKNATVTDRGITTSLENAADFMAFVSRNFSKIAPHYHLPKNLQPTKPVYATAATLVRTGTGNIEMAASGTIDLSNGAPEMLNPKNGKLAPLAPGQPQLGGAAVYTAGQTAALGQTSAVDAVNGQTYAVDLAANMVVSNQLATQSPQGFGYGQGGGVSGILIADPVYASGGGDISLSAGADVLGRRDTALESALGGFDPNSAGPAGTWIGSGVQPWRTGSIGVAVNALIDPQLFQEGVGTLGGGSIRIAAGRTVSDLSTVATTALTTASVADGSIGAGALVTLGSGNVHVTAGGDILGGRLDVASGQAALTAAGSIASAGPVTFTGVAFGSKIVDDLLRVRLTDATVQLTASGTVAIEGIAALGVDTSGPTTDAQFTANFNAKGFYSPLAGVAILANGPVSVANQGGDVVITNINTNVAETIYPGAFSAISLTGDLAITTASGNLQADNILMYPAPTGTLRLIAGGNIDPLTIAMEDADPSILPGAFSSYAFATGGGAGSSGLGFVFPAVLPNTSDITLRLQHNPNPTHANDPNPNLILAGGDITGLIFSSPKMARISAGQDLINAVFFGQNLSPTDVTEINAGRDIVGTTMLDQAIVNGVASGPFLPAVQGNTFVIGGPGSLFLEAGRDAGPFLNSAVTDGNSVGSQNPTGVLTWSGGVQSVGNLWNPWLPAQGASLVTEFGVAKGQNFIGLISSYLDPTSFAAAPSYLFEQTTAPDGVVTVDRTAQIYSLDLISWLKSIAPTILAKFQTSETLSGGSAIPSALVQVAQTLQAGGAVSLAQALAALPQAAGDRMPLIPWLQLNYGSLLTARYGTLDVSYSQAFAAFQSLPTLNQRPFLLEDVYFNELVQTSIPSSPSYLQYSRGYLAVNTLFPAALGYTQNNLSGGGGGNGANSLVVAGNLDLRLSTIQTDQGGDIVVLGPGGRIIAGSTVRTSEQAARRVYAGGALFSGFAANTPPTSLGYGVPNTAAIIQIPSGYEGILALQGGNIDGFTDESLLLNQSRLFTEGGGDIALWSSNADLNAGQGPRSSADFPPVVVRIDENAFSEINVAAGVTGAGIAAFQPDPTAPPPDVFLIAPRGTVDAGAAGVRSAGNIFIAAFQVANATGFQAQGSVTGLGGPAAVNVAAQTSASAASTAAAAAAQAAINSGNGGVDRTLITVDVLGYLAGLSDDTSGEDDKRRKKQK